ncbi:MAG: alpha-mannosidase [Clostridiales bacterium]|nr:alpha-mannosidase [Clostridiales bacterium]
MKKNLHLICNAHIDPVWLWEIEEGVAETLSTFRVAADFCEDYKGFVFCHNEAMLYEWVEENDPALFGRIQKLVKKGKWHVMGGWYLQPDCNLPAGESFVRQILAGKYYFLEKFGVEPKTVINFDAFGHTRGLVDIMKHAGYDSYIFCRPEPDMLDLPAEDFNWVGFDGSKIACHRAYNSYESHRGEADEKIKGWMEKNRGKSVGLVLWGIGDHGGGPSRIDYEKIEALGKAEKEFKLIHSTPEAYFEELQKTEALPDYDGLMNPRYTGCYTTQMRIKKLHRRLENELYMTEKMAAHAMMAGVMDYPADKIKAATKDLMMLEFHDILPGSAIQPVEEYSTALAGHGLTELKTIKIRAFLALCSDKKKAEDGTIPVFVYNPHPYEVEETVEVEYQLPDQNKNPALFANPIVYENGKIIPSQCEHELSNFNVDWRKRSVFTAKLAPGQMKRFDVRIELIPTPEPNALPDGAYIDFKTDSLEIRVNRSTGLIDRCIINGISAVKENAFRPLAVCDDENSWAHKEKSFREIKGEFTLMSPEEGTKFSGVTCGDILPSVRIIEDGSVRTVVEAVFSYADSFLCRRYYLPKTGTDLKICDKVYWNEKMTMLKLSVPTAFDKLFIGQTAYGSEKLLTNGDEMVSQKWNLISDGKNALTVINDGTYGSDCKDGELRITMLRSPGYSAGKSDFSVRKPYIMEQDRFSPFIDQGEHDYEFHFTAGSLSERLAHIEREAAAIAEKPMALSFFPIGCAPEKENTIQPFAVLSDDVITLSVFKKAEIGEDSVIRLFNPTADSRKTTLALPSIAFSREFELSGYEIKTVRINLKTKEVTEVDLTER